ncbi:MAG: mannose-1-phosphate guanylyltransferase, partial [Nitrospinae bacterium]|nr:mannose-1-phosphate guanylyltransferase [Nitrospinota bacterium]
LSKSRTPKQLLNLTGDNTLIQKTINRIKPIIKNKNIFIVTANSHVKKLKEQINDIPLENIINEPFGRNTAPCIGLASLFIKKIDRSGVMVVLPADHIIKDEDAFRDIISAGTKVAAERDYLVTLGIKPSYPETGYGYIHAGKRLDKRSGVRIFKVKRFVEKPDINRAKRYIAGGDYFWNGGVFMWRVETILTMIKRFMPDLYDGLMYIEKAIGTKKERSAVRNIYSRIPAISIDHGIMEKAPDVAVIPCDIGWSDVGTWRALYDILDKDDFNNVVVGKFAGIDTKGCVIHSPEKLVAAIGIKDIVIVASKDAVLICPKEKAQDVKNIVELLKSKGFKRYL